MADTIHVTNQVTGNTGINRSGQMPKDIPGVTAVEPSRVSQAGGKQEEQHSGSGPLLNRSSAFQTFIQQLHDTPPLQETLPKILMTLRNHMESTQKAGETPALMEQLSASMDMDAAGILEAMKYQANNLTKFSPPLFSALRQLLRKYPESDLRYHLARFLKSYDAYFSAPDTMNALIRQLNTLLSQLPRGYSKKLQPLTEEMLPSNADQALEKNLHTMKESILPVLRQYAALTKDTGTARDTINLITHTLARLNTASREDLVQKFITVTEYCRYSLGMAPESLQVLEQQFAALLTKPDTTQENALFDALFHLLADGCEKSSSPLTQALYRDICSSLLINNSVFMPYEHLLLPVMWQGHSLFSEIFIEKDPPQEQSSVGPPAERLRRLMLTFDINELGYFEMIIEIVNAKADIQLCCPPSLPGLGGSIDSIQKAVTAIFTRNGLTPSSVQISTDNTPRVHEKVLQRTAEWRSGIDVKI